MSVKIKLKKLNENAKLPTQGKPGDFCYDVWAVSEKEVAPNVWEYGLGLAYEFDASYYVVARGANKWTSSRTSEVLNLSIDFRCRSSVWKTGMVLSNAYGTLDYFYRGEAKAVFYHVFPNMPRYKVGDKIGQIKIGMTIPAEFEFVDEINMDTERGTGGFGSTDEKKEKEA